MSVLYSASIYFRLHLCNYATEKFTDEKSGNMVD